MRVARGVAEEGYAGPGTGVIALNLDPSMDLDRDCEHNPESINRCVTSLEEFQAFAAEHNLPADVDTAEIFQAYVRRDLTKGDRLYATVKGMPVESLEDPDFDFSEPPRLIIDIVPTVTQ